MSNALVVQDTIPRNCQKQNCLSLDRATSWGNPRREDGGAGRVGPNGCLGRRGRNVGKRDPNNREPVGPGRHFTRAGWPACGVCRICSRRSGQSGPRFAPATVRSQASKTVSTFVPTLCIEALFSVANAPGAQVPKIRRSL